MTPGLRKVALTTHVVCTVGWLGSVVSFFALALVGLISPNLETVRAVYLAGELMTWLVIVPLAAASLVTGIAQGLGTSWGLFRHYWVVFKLALTVLGSVVLAVHTQPIGTVADAARQAGFAASDLHALRVQLVADAAAATLLLLTAAVLSIFKPRGLTPHGQRTRAGRGPVG